MIREGESRCVSCHVDPSGGGLLTAFGREQGADILRTRFSANEDQEAITRRGKFLWGAFDTPDWLLLGGAFRPALLITHASEGGQSITTRTGIIMQADLRAGIRADGWRASATVGAISNNSYASITGNVISREHWVGYAFDSDTYTVRAGRMPSEVNFVDSQRSIYTVAGATAQTKIVADGATCTDVRAALPM